MKQIIYNCDRCGNTYEPYESRSGFQGVQAFKRNRQTDENTPRFSYGYRKYLCPICMAEMESWMFEEKDLAGDEEDFHQVDGETPFDDGNVPED